MNYLEFALEYFKIFMPLLCFLIGYLAGVNKK